MGNVLQQWGNVLQQWGNVLQQWGNVLQQWGNTVKRHMAAQEKTLESQSPSHIAARASFIVLLLGVLFASASLLFGSRLFGQISRHYAARDLSAWALGDALAWLDKSDRIEPENPQTELMRARCYRHTSEVRLREKALARAEQFGASQAALESEIILGKIQTGDFSEGADRKVGELLDAGHSPQDIAAAFVNGYIIRNNPTRAQAVLDTWAADDPNQAHTQYLRGLLLGMAGDSEGTRQAFERTLAMEPRHELAQFAIAQQHEVLSRPAEALKLYEQLAQGHPENEAIFVGMARSLRKLDRVQQARSVLEPFVSKATVNPEIVVEMGFIELVTGDFLAANRWFEQAVAADMVDPDTLGSACIALIMTGQTVAARLAFEWLFEEKNLSGLFDDAENRLAMDPNDRVATAELADLHRINRGRPSHPNPYQIALAAAAATQSDLSNTMRLYGQHCSACHGDTGDGKGRAARHLFPRPRDLRNERSKLASTCNGIPSRDDVRSVIKLGIPGTSMVPLATLSDVDIDQLIDVVLKMRAEGIREQYIALLTEEDEPIDELDVQEVVDLRTTPGELVAVPEIVPANAEHASNGKELYVQQTCHSCHGETGEGDESTPLFDDLGRPAFPRDLVFDLFKGGNKGKSIYLRLLLGMPGTPHPANVTLNQSELVALTHYCLALGQEPKRILTNHQRAIRAARRPAIELAKP